MTLEKLKELGFELQPEQDRAVLILTEDEKIKLIVNQDEQLILNWLGNTCKLGADSLDKENIISALKQLFQGKKAKEPF